MNKKKLKELMWSRVRLRRPAISVLGGRVVDRRDDVWIVTGADDAGLRIQNTVTGHVAALGHDHIHAYDSDHQSEWDGLRHGFLRLTSQIYMSGYRLWYEPLPEFQRRAHLGRPAAATG